MAVEIELKARLEDPEPVKKRLSETGVFLHAYEKDDCYLVSADKALTIRVRRERLLRDDTVTERVLVTYKTKEITDGVEVNDEREFQVSDAEAFEEFLDYTGFSPDIKKEKRGWAWQMPAQMPARIPPVLAEVSNVKNLGWFLELEILTEDRSEKTVAENRKRLFDLLAVLEIAPEQIEARPYTVMLRRP